MKLFHPRKPFQEGYFKVDNGHQLYYAVYGNPQGIPVLYVHGGPGSGCGEDAHRYFDPKKFKIIIVDQRGAGKSKPFASLNANTTKNLVEDFRKILDFLNVKHVYLFGGSWGSCLSLCFAVKYPSRVKGMVLRGIFLGDQDEIDFILKGIIRTHFPKEWGRFAGMAPKKYRADPAPYYGKMLNSVNENIVRKYAKEWIRFEMSLISLVPNPKMVNEIISKRSVISFAKIEAHYLLNKCFIPDRYILKNIKKIKHIPLVIVHGRYDFVCEPRIAYQLHMALPKSKLHFVIGGHWSKDPEVRSLLMKEIHAMAKK